MANIGIVIAIFLQITFLTIPTFNHSTLYVIDAILKGEVKIELLLVILNYLLFAFQIYIYQMFTEDFLFRSNRILKYKVSYPILYNAQTNFSVEEHLPPQAVLLLLRHFVR